MEVDGSCNGHIETSALAFTRPLTMTRHRVIYRAPEFRRRLSGEEAVQEGENATFTCRVVGLPKPSLRWFKDNEEIIDHPRIIIKSKDGEEYSLSVENTNKGDEAAYKCQAENSEGSCTSTVFLGVKGRARRKRRKCKTPNRRQVSLSPQISTIAEKAEEEQREGMRVLLTVDPRLISLYHETTVNTRLEPPKFLGHWAFVVEGGGDDLKRFLDDDCFIAEPTYRLNGDGDTNKNAADVAEKEEYKRKFISAIPSFHAALPDPGVHFDGSKSNEIGEKYEKYGLGNTFSRSCRNNTKEGRPVVFTDLPKLSPVNSSKGSYMKSRQPISRLKPGLDNKSTSVADSTAACRPIYRTPGSFPQITKRRKTNFFFYLLKWYYVNMAFLVCAAVFLSLHFETGVLKLISNVLFLFVIYSVLSV